MASASKLDATWDPLAQLDCELERIWVCIGEVYDVAGPVPGLSVLFAGADLADATAAAEVVLANMLLDVAERSPRYSPWYTRPAAAYGLARERDKATGQVDWRLNTQARQRWQPLLQRLGQAITASRSLLQIFVLVDDFLEGEPLGEEAVLCCCACEPPRYIWLPRCVVSQGAALCDDCQTAFNAVDHP